MHQTDSPLIAQLRWLRDAPDLICPPAELRLPLQPAGDEQLLRACSQEAQFQPGFRLGERFETLITLYLKYASQITDTKHNIQVKGAAETIGELDFLLPLRGRWCHLEVALKLYLLDGKGDDLQHYVGTRRDDCLATKWSRLLQHQLTLGGHPDARRVLQQMGISLQPQPAVWIKGWLFYHRGNKPAHIPTPLNPEHQHGWWLTHAELAELQDFGQHFMIPSKDEWLLPARMINRPVLDFAQLREQVLPQDRAQLILTVEQHAQGWVESSRGFVVADHWPRTAQQS